MEGLTSMTVFFVFFRLLLLAATPAFTFASQSRYEDAVRAEDSTWHQYIRAPSSTIVRPISIVPDLTRGDVTSPEAMVDQGNDSITIFRRANDSSGVPSVVIDFGKVVVGLLAIDFVRSNPQDGATKGTRPGLKLTFSEALEFMLDKSDFTRSDHAEAGGNPLKITLGTDQVCADGLHSFRYVRISLDALPQDEPYTSSKGEIHIASVSLQWSAFLGTLEIYTGWFECSDADLTQWWYDGSYTAEMCVDEFRANDTEPRRAMSETLVGKLVVHDAPKRDRDPYVGDLAVAGPTLYVTHDLAQPLINVLEDLAAHQRGDGWIPPASIYNYTVGLYDYPLWWVSSVWDLVMYTGNISFAKAHYPNLLAVLDKYYPAHMDGHTGLLLRQEGYGDYAFTPRVGAAGYYSAVYVIALKRAADIAGWVGASTSAEDARRWRDRAEEISELFHSTLWDSKAQAYWDRACIGCDSHAQDGNSLAILANIATGSTAKSVLQYLGSDAHNRPYGHAFYDHAGAVFDDSYPNRVYAFISFFEVAARFLTPGFEDSAVDQLRQTWGYMSKSDPGITFWEGIGINGSKYEGPFTSLAHGWSTGIMPLLTSYVLGVEPTGPGYSTWSLWPRPGSSVTWARGRVPTPHGPLLVDWQFRADQATYVVNVDAPKGTEGKVTVRAKSGASISVDGKIVSHGEQGILTMDGDKAIAKVSI